MAGKIFRAFLVSLEGENEYIRSITERSTDELPEGDVLIRVAYSSLNLKDAFSTSGVKGITRRYPHTPGIDAAGTVEECASGAFSPGERVLVTGYDLGMNTSGGLGEYIRVPADWVVRIPEGLTERTAMMYGTAGFTAALCVKRLVDSGLAPGDGDVLVTGATGGVGSIAVGLLAKLGYSVIGGTGKAEAKEMLLSLGAKDIALRSELEDATGKALLKERWAGVVDTVGGNILSTAIRSTRYGGSVALCGNAASPELQLTVFPFILKGISLLGVDSVQCPMPLRQEVWRRLAGDWNLLPGLESHITEIDLPSVSGSIDKLLKGQAVGRYLVRHGA